MNNWQNLLKCTPSMLLLFTVVAALFLLPNRWVFVIAPCLVILGILLVLNSARIVTQRRPTDDAAPFRSISRWTGVLCLAATLLVSMLHTRIAYVIHTTSGSGIHVGLTMFLSWVDKTASYPFFSVTLASILPDLGYRKWAKGTLEETALVLNVSVLLVYGMITAIMIMTLKPPGLH